MRKSFKSYAMSATLIKDIPGGMNIMSDLRKIKARNKKEAIGEYVLQINKEFKEHYIHCRPLIMEIKEALGLEAK